jgi:hypothetical protein
MGQDRFIPRAGPCASTCTPVGARPRPGRIQQIRIHLASMGQPVVSQVSRRRRSRLPDTRTCMHGPSGSSTSLPGSTSAYGTAGVDPAAMLAVLRESKQRQHTHNSGPIAQRVFMRRKP